MLAENLKAICSFALQREKLFCYFLIANIMKWKWLHQWNDWERGGIASSMREYLSWACKENSQEYSDYKKMNKKGKSEMSEASASEYGDASHFPLYSLTMIWEMFLRPWPWEAAPGLDSSWAYQKTLSTPRNYCCLMSSCFFNKQHWKCIFLAWITTQGE